MIKKEQVYSILKPKAKAYGFNSSELMSVASYIGDNLNSTDDTPEEELNAEIEEKVNAVLPLLKIGQSFANRVIEASRKPEGNNGENDAKEGKTTKSEKSAEEKQFQELLDELKNLKGEMAKLSGERIADVRRQKLSERLKDTGVFGDREMKNFGRMSFATEEEFETYLSEVDDHLKLYNQELADAGLRKTTPPPAVGGDTTTGEVISDADIERIVNLN